MIITEPQEKLTIETLDALLANFVTGILTLDELWEVIDNSKGMRCFHDKFMSDSFELPEFAENRMSSVDAGTGI